MTSKAKPVPRVMPNLPSLNRYVGGFRIEPCEKVLQMGSMLTEDVGIKTVLDRPAKAAFQEAMRDERYKGKDAQLSIGGEMRVAEVKGLILKSKY